MGRLRHLSLVNTVVLSCVATTACAAFIEADVSATVLGTPGTQNQTVSPPTPGPVFASTSLTPFIDNSNPSIPYGGGYSAGAVSDYGTLKANAFVTVTNGPGPLNPAYSTSGTTRAVAMSRFQDRLIIFGQPTDTLATLRIYYSFDGLSSSNATDATTEAVGRYVLNASSNDAIGNTIDAQTYDSTKVASANISSYMDLQFDFGRPIFIDGTLTASVNVFANPGTLMISGDGTANFGNTARITGLAVNAGTGWTSSFSLTSDSGATYVPEPTSGLLLLMGLVSVLGRRAR